MGAIKLLEKQIYKEKFIIPLNKGKILLVLIKDNNLMQL